MDPTKIKPLHGQVLIKMDPCERQLETGIWVSDHAFQHTYTGQVLAVGPGHVTSPCPHCKATTQIKVDLEPGDKVWFGILRAGKDMALTWTWQGDKYLLEDSSHVFAKETV